MEQQSSGYWKKNFLNLYGEKEHEKVNHGPAIASRAEFAINNNRNNKNICYHARNFLQE